MRDRAVNAGLSASIVLCAATLVVLAVLASEPRTDAPARPIPEDIARLVAEKDAARERADALQRLDALASIAGVVLGSSAAALAVRLAGPPHPVRWLAAIGGAIAIGGPMLLWAAYCALGARNSPVLPEIVWLPLIGVAVGVAGWLLTAAALRPAGSALRGLAMGAVVYSAAGLISLFAINALSGNIVAGLPAVLADPVAFYVTVLLWPLRIAAMFGLFGLTFGQ